MQPSVHNPHYIPIVFHNFSGYDMHLFIRELGKKFDSESISVNAENKKKYISCNVSVSVDEYKTPLGKKKQITRWLQFIDSIMFMSGSLDLLSRNLVGVNQMVYKGCGSEAELAHIDEKYVTHGMCIEMPRCKPLKLGIDMIFDNLRVSHTDEQF